jgi:hypothetical protein
MRQLTRTTRYATSQEETAGLKGEAARLQEELEAIKKRLLELDAC